MALKYDSRAENIRQALKNRGWTINDGGFSFFVSVWRTSTNNESITLPLPLGYNYNFQVNWGDGSSSEVTAHDDSDITHTYAEAGDYTMTISETLEAWNFKNYAIEHRSKLIFVKDLGDVDWKDLQEAFYYCRNLESLRGGNVSGVISMRSMFHTSFQGSVLHPDVSRWDTSKVTDMKSMFEQALSAQPNMSQWDFRNVKIMRRMLRNIILPTEVYSRMIKQIHSTSQKNNISFHGGNSKYNNSAIDARAALIARKWTIVDGGLDGGVGE